MFFPSLGNGSDSTFCVENYDEEGQQSKIAPEKYIYDKNITVFNYDSNKKIPLADQIVLGVDISFLPNQKTKQTGFFPSNFC